jgi:hypothetical protein
VCPGDKPGLSLQAADQKSFVLVEQMIELGPIGVKFAAEIEQRLEYLLNLANPLTNPHFAPRKSP